jgi:hypothetical protein
MNNKEFKQELLLNIQLNYYNQIEILSLSVFFLLYLKTIT